MTIHDEAQNLCSRIRGVNITTDRLRLFELLGKSAELVGRMSMKISDQAVEIIRLKEQVKKYQKENGS